MQWHIIIVTIIIFILSITSWFNFARSTGRIIKHQYLDRKETEITLDKGSIDALIDQIDSMWSVCKMSELSSIDSLVTYFVIGEISSDQVISGTNRWLFYNSIDDFEGTSRYSAPELENMAQSALFTQNGLEEKGIKLAIVVAPNKDNIYPEFMPDIYTHAERSRTDELIEYLMQRGVNIVSPKHALLENHLSQQVYYSYDSHWNQLGAYIGVRDTLNSLNISMPELSKRNILSSELRGHYHYCAEDDLAKMVGLRLAFSDEKEYEVDGTVLMDWVAFDSEQTAETISHFYNENAVRKESVFLVGDSFRSSMVPALREQFSDVYVVHRSYYTPEMLDDIHPDYLIAEYVERFSDQIEKINSLLETA